MSGEIRRRNTKCVCRRALAFLAITVAGFSTPVGGAQTPDLECAQLSNVPDDGTPLAVGLKDVASKKSILRKQSQHVDLLLEPIRSIRLSCSCSAEHFPWGTNDWRQ